MRLTHWSIDESKNSKFLKEKRKKNLRIGSYSNVSFNMKYFVWNIACDWI